MTRGGVEFHVGQAFQPDRNALGGFRQAGKPDLLGLSDAHIPALLRFMMLTPELAPTRARPTPVLPQTCCAARRHPVRPRVPFSMLRYRHGTHSRPAWAWAAPEPARARPARYRSEE